MAWKRQGSKYGSKRVQIEGDVFDSKKEAKRWLILKEMERMGMIKDLKRQVRYVLIPTQREPDSKTKTGKIKKGRVIERECVYVADFVYEQDGQTIVEDTKGFRTTDYIIKRKLMLWVHGIQISEV